MAALRGAGTHFPCHNALDAICNPLTFQQPIYSQDALGLFSTSRKLTSSPWESGVLSWWSFACFVFSAAELWEGGAVEIVCGIHCAWF